MAVSEWGAHDKSQNTSRVYFPLIITSCKPQTVGTSFKKLVIFESNQSRTIQMHRCSRQLTIRHARTI